MLAAESRPAANYRECCRTTCVCGIEWALIEFINQPTGLCRPRFTPGYGEAMPGEIAIHVESLTCVRLRPVYGFTTSESR